MVWEAILFCPKWARVLLTVSGGGGGGFGLSGCRFEVFKGSGFRGLRLRGFKGGSSSGFGPKGPQGFRV